MKTILHLIIITLVWLAVYLLQGVNYRNQIESYQRALADLRTEAARVNGEVICYRYLFNEYEPIDAIVDECEWEYGIDVTKL